MSIVAQRRSGVLWHLWNTDYLGCGPEASDEGFILRTDQGWALHASGRRARLRDTYSSLEEAMRAGRVDRRWGARLDHHVRL